MLQTIALALCMLVLPVAAEPHRVLSFNIRFASAADGPDAWGERREKVVETIRDLDADVAGLQEAEATQVRELLAALPDYAAVGAHRDDGRLAGEATPILFNRTRYALVSAETFWLSDTPEVVASNTWGAACNRTCTRASLLDLESGETFTVYNTHFDHRSSTARQNSARLIVSRIEGRSPIGPVVVMGDFNAGEGTPVLETLRAGGDAWELIDTFREKHPDEPAGTFTGFDTASDGGGHKIDYVLIGPGFGVLDAGIDRRKIGGRYPSDHFPVWADLRVTE